MHILVTGGTGFIGSALVPALLADDHQVTVLSRTPRQSVGSLHYTQVLTDISAPVDAVINLAGASLAAKRWTRRYKAEIIQSRVDFTHELVAWMASQSEPPAVLLSGSAIGWYGASQEVEFDEKSRPGHGFAAALCHRWEAAALEAESLGTRVVLLRLGVVLDRDGGAYAEMTRSFAAGVCSWLGSGEQWLSWVHRRDVVQSILMLLTAAQLSGPVNVVAPEPVSHRAFAAAVAGQTRTWLAAGVPAMLARTLIGEMADELLLTGQRVRPAVLQAAGYQFAFPDVSSTVAALGAQR